MTDQNLIVLALAFTKAAGFFMGEGVGKSEPDDTGR
jgi:hypothetical protein